MRVITPSYKALHGLLIGCSETNHYLFNFLNTRLSIGCRRVDGCREGMRVFWPLLGAADRHVLVIVGVDEIGVPRDVLK